VGLGRSLIAGEKVMLKLFKKLFGGPVAEPPKTAKSLQTALAGQERAERGQRYSDEHFAHLVSGVRDYAIFLLDREGYIRTWNAGAERIKGYRAEEIIGQHFSRFYPKDSVSSGWPAHELRVAAATGRFEDEAWRLRKDGSRFWANVIITALRDESGEVRGFLKITRDLTDRKQAEEKLRLSEERFRLLVERVKDYAIFMLDPQGRVATWNAGAQRLKGYAAEEIIGEHFSRFYPKEDVESDKPGHNLEIARKMGRYEEEGWRVRKDGSLFWASVVITALRDEAGVLRGFGKVTRDMTERKQAEENARRLLEEELARRAAEDRAAAVREERERLRVMLHSIGDGVIATDAGGQVTLLNPAAETLTGWTSAEAVGQPLQKLFHLINEATRQEVENPVAKVLRQGASVSLENHTVLITRSGTERPIDDSAAPIMDNKGRLVGAVLVFRDVTERRQAERERQQLLERERRARAQAEAAGERLAFLAEASAVLSSSLDYAATLDTVARLAVTRLADWCSVELVEGDAATLQRVAVVHKEAAKIELANDLRRRYPPDPNTPSGVAKVLRTGQAELVPEISDAMLEAAARDPDHLRILWGLGLKSVMIVPLVARGATIGVLMFASEQTGRRFHETDLALAEDLARRCAAAIDNSRLYRQAQEKVQQHRQMEEQLTLLIDASGALTSTLEPGAVLSSVVRLSQRLLPADAHGLWRFHAPSGQWRLVSSAGLSDGYQQATIKLLGQAFQMPDRPVVAEDVFQLPLLAERRKGYRAEGIRSLIALPLRIHGQVCGTLTVYHRQPHAFSEAEIRIASALGNLAAAAIGSADLYQEQAQLRAETHEQKEWFRITLSSIGDAMIATDTAGRVTFLNPVAAALTGWAPEEAQGRTLETVFQIVNEQTRQSVENPAARALREGRVVGLANHTLLIAKDGRERPIDDSAAPIQNEQGGTVGVVLVFRDMTERRRVEQELREADRRKNEFLATLAHELRNPLAPIRTGLQVLRLATDASDRHQALEMMDRQLGQLVRLVDDLLDISRITRNKLELRKARLPLTAVIENAIETARPLIESKGHTLAVTLPPEPLYLDADLTRLAQVFWNLLHNSAKYTDPGGRIILAAERQESDVIVTIRDTGIGIPAEAMPGLFTMFSQVDQSLERAQGGLGIGLALVKGLVEMHGGTVEAHSGGTGQGSEFRVCLPLAAEKGQTDEPRQRFAAASGITQRILVVDDNRDSAASLGMMLSLLGHDTRTAHDGLEAVELAEAFHPDVVLLDIGLPRLNGYDACQRIREQPWGKDMFIVAVTGWGQAEDRRRSQEAGFDQHLVKPVDPAQLQQLLALAAGRLGH
jgi:PAS domain S-box-containing protein